MAELSVLPVKIGILGCAEIARKLSRAIHLVPEDVCISAIGSRSESKAIQFAAANGFPVSAKVYGSYDAVLEDPDVDAIYMPLPTSLHLKWAVLAAQKQKHLLVEKPVAMHVDELDAILEACDDNGVQYMDGTMLQHHPRSAKMREYLDDAEHFGQLRSIISCFTFAASPDYLANNIRTKPDLDGLGALGDIGWHCIRSILWAADFELPKFAIALPGPVLNKAGVIISCGASLHWEDGKTATLNCSFLENLTMDVTLVGTKGTLHMHDFNIPFEEGRATFSTGTKVGVQMICQPGGRSSTPSIRSLLILPQECLMLKEFSRLVANIKSNGAKPEKKWATYSRKTQLTMDPIKESVLQMGFQKSRNCWLITGLVVCDRTPRHPVPGKVELVV
uniref:AX110P n=1 Tax=Daucus carota TaxID=4039 RepID=Q39684_DAUCA|nr:AX110P [Daucus carota]prf//2004427A embryogenesis-associated protein [Daucus carota]